MICHDRLGLLIKQTGDKKSALFRTEGVYDVPEARRSHAVREHHDERGNPHQIAAICVV